MTLDTRSELGAPAPPEPPEPPEPSEPSEPPEPPSGGLPESPEPPEPPELSADDLDAIRRHLEERWLADSIPALGGQTPREAAGSERRGDLIALLDDYEWADRRSPSPMAMDLGRLRRELGLE